MVAYCALDFTTDDCMRMLDSSDKWIPFVRIQNQDFWFLSFFFFWLLWIAWLWTFVPMYKNFAVTVLRIGIARIYHNEYSKLPQQSEEINCSLVNNGILYNHEWQLMQQSMI